MTDLEMTRLCAEAMGLPWKDSNIGPPWNRTPVIYSGDIFEGVYDPLHDDVQAMALVKKMNLTIYPPGEMENEAWNVFHYDDFNSPSDSLNCAIVECVAKMQAAKSSSK